MIKKSKWATLLFLPMYLFTAVFVLCPLIFMIVLSVSKQVGWGYEVGFSLDNYSAIFSKTYFEILKTSLKLATLSTAIVILIGYPFGLSAAFLPDRYSKLFFSLQMIPYWVNSLLRLYGFIIIFRANGILDKLLMWAGITTQPIKLLYSYPAVVVGMVYALLPFMFTSVYQVAKGLDLSVVEASYDLGAKKIRSFFTIIVPLTLSGLKTGIILTFIPSMGLFFIAQILGGSKTVLVGSLIEELLMKAHNQPAAAALSVVIMLLTGVVCALLMKKPKWSAVK